MDKKFKPKLISSLRKLSYAYPPRNAAKAKRKRGPATYECEQCNVYVYEGAKNLSEIKKLFPKTTPLVAGKACVDHIVPVVPPTGFDRGFWDWHEYVIRMFCDEEGFQVLCESCHDTKTAAEDELRRLTRMTKKGTIDPNKEIL